MTARFLNWLRTSFTLLQAVALVLFCLLIAAAFALGALLGRGHPAPPPPPIFGVTDLDASPRGTFGAIEAIRGDVIQVRDPRSGRTWSVRAGRNTVIEGAPRARIPFKNLRVGQRVFVVGVANTDKAANEFDAQFIGVVMGQQQRFVRPAIPPVMCWDCVD